MFLRVVLLALPVLGGLLVMRVADHKFHNAVADLCRKVAPASVAGLVCPYYKPDVVLKTPPVKIKTAPKCCSKLRISGTKVDDPWYQNIMGEYSIFEELPFLDYEKKGKVSGRYPVYFHDFTDFTPTEERPNPPRSFLYYYINEHPSYPEKECKDRGCWIISMYDASPGNYWFGKKWYYVKTNPVPKCPEGLPTGNSVFINDKGQGEEDLKVECIER